MARHPSVIVMLAVAAFLTLSYFMSIGRTGDDTHHVLTTPESQSVSSATGAQLELGVIPNELLTGDVIAPKLENATAKAELGRASWKLLHTMMARFPDKPTADDSLALKSYIQLFARLYPCGDCARHFQKLLAKYPPQVGSRSAAAVWACFVHNEVNKRLEKPAFDCNNIGDFYDCGCGEDGKEGGQAGAPSELKME
jgi:FAD-linked sulfhydryl oxidase